LENAVEVKELTKSYGSLIAVDHVSFEVKGKEIFGLLGPNGAGKTTTIRMICGMLRPTKGTAVVAGFDVSQKPQEVKRRIGLVPDISNLFGELSARINLEFMGKLYGLDKKTRRERIDQVLELFHLKERQNPSDGRTHKRLRRPSSAFGEGDHNRPEQRGQSHTLDHTSDRRGRQTRAESGHN